MGRNSNSNVNSNVMRKKTSIVRPKYTPAHAKAIHDAAPKIKKTEVNLLTNILHSDFYTRSINAENVIFYFSSEPRADNAIRTFNHLNYELVSPTENDKEFIYTTKNNNAVTISREHYDKLCRKFPNKYCLDVDLIFAPLKNTIVENEKPTGGSITLPPLQSLTNDGRTAENRRTETISFYLNRGNQIFTDIKHMIDRFEKFDNIKDPDDSIITVIKVQSVNVSRDVTTELNRFSFLANK